MFMWPSQHHKMLIKMIYISIKILFKLYRKLKKNGPFIIIEAVNHFISAQAHSSALLRIHVII